MRRRPQHRVRILAGATVIVACAHAARAQAPTITEQPQSQTVCAGSEATFRVVAQGSGLSYQWLFNDELIAGATLDTLTLVAVDAADAGVYNVTVSNASGSVTSDDATLTVDSGPQIVTQPASQTVCQGQPLHLSVGLASGGAAAVSDTIGSAGSSGAGPRLRGNYYQVTSSTTLTRIEHYLNITTSGPIVFFVYEATAQAGPYTLIAQDALGSSGVGQRFYSSGSLTVPLAAGRYYVIGAGWPGSHTYYFNAGPNPPPHPQPTAFGASVQGFQAAYQSPLPTTAPNNTSSFAHYQRLTTSRLALSYQWRKDDEDIPAATGPEYDVAAATPTDAGDYQVVVTSQCGTASSQVATVTIEPPPQITQPPQDEAACVGGSAAFSVVATGTGLTYQWRQGGGDIPGATAPFLSISPVEPADAGSYDVVVTSACASVTSAPATLIVSDSPPVITQPPQSLTVCAGQPATFTVEASGQGLSYQWRKNGLVIGGATGPAYTIPAASTSDVGDYDVRVTNPCGQVLSLPASLALDTPISIVQQPGNAAVCTGDAVALTVGASGTNVTYQWRKDGVPLAGATGSTLSFDPAQAADAGVYDAVLSNACGAVTSSPAVLTVGDRPQIVTPPQPQTVAEGEPFALLVEAAGGDAAAVDTIGSSENSSQGPRIRANCYGVTRTATLLRIEHYLVISADGLLRFFVYEADAAEGPWTLILEDTVASSGVGERFFGSNPLSLTLEAGRFYLIGTAWPGNHRYFWGGVHPQPTAFGQTVPGRGWATLYLNPLPGSPSNTSSLVHHQRLTTADDLVTYQWRLDGLPLPGATGESYTVDSAACSDGGMYDVLVGNSCGTTVSPAVRVTVYPPADVNRDGRVTLVDLSILLTHFGMSSGATREDGDLNGDGAVTLVDLSILLTGFGFVCS